MSPRQLYVDKMTPVSLDYSICGCVYDNLMRLPIFKFNRIAYETINSCPATILCETESDFFAPCVDLIASPSYPATSSALEREGRPDQLAAYIVSRPRVGSSLGLK